MNTPLNEIIYMTYRELLTELTQLTDEQLDMDVSIYTMGDYKKDEFYELDCIDITDVDDILDKNHPYLVV